MGVVWKIFRERSREWIRTMRRRRWRIVLILCGCFLVLFYFCLPSQLFQDPYSTILFSRDGRLLSAAIAQDGQWRFPESDTVPEKFIQALTTYEDKRFYTHPGVDILSFGRAVQQNISAGEVVSGGSTLTMQTIRLSRKGQLRSILEKCIEMVMALRMEFRYSKSEIIALYASHAPFGGNVVGIDAACWRYFGRDQSSISWGEAALLAVLPNSPALIHPGRNRTRLQQKRDHLLDRLWKNATIDSITCVLAKEEPIPEEPLPLPRMARHLLARVKAEAVKGNTNSSLDYELQLRVEQIVQNHHQRLIGNLIHNAAVLVADVETGNVLAYVGNITSQSQYDGDEVDIITSPRSTGSILKPFLYAAMLDDGKILPTTLLVDVPMFINGFSPKNFSKGYDGAVHADEALIRSLNIPAVNLLREYRYERFHALLGRMGMTTLNHPPDHYGLSLILGGAEGTLWDVCGMYASMSRSLNHYFEHPGKNKYDRHDFHPLRFIPTSMKETADLSETALINAAAAYKTFDALKELYRPGEESGWRLFESSKQIAWKTGTSFGFRDGWAIGVTPRYVVGVWTGNCDGEGRPGLTGTEAAAPLMFDVFAQLTDYTWFKEPRQEMERVTVCSLSGHRNTPLCSKVDTVWLPREGLATKPCPYHKQVFLAPDRRARVHSDCQAIDKMVATSWFVLPPVQE